MLLENGQQAADFINVFAPILKKSGYSTKQACCDAGGWEFQRYLLAGIQAADAEKHLGIVTAHGYITPPTTPFNTTKKVCTYYVARPLAVSNRLHYVKLTHWNRGDRMGRPFNTGMFSQLQILYSS